MTGVTPFKKLLLSIGCAFLLILYVPLACLVGNDTSRDTGMAIAETESDQYGFWRFSDVYPAEYTLRVTPPSEVKPTVSGVHPLIISSVLEETDDTECVSGPVQVESDRANYNADMGFVCRKPGVTPPGYGEGETQDWSKQSSGSDK